MAQYQVVNLEEYMRRKRAAHPGRPRKYAEGVSTVSISFRVPEALRDLGRDKAQSYNVNMTELLAYQYKQFVVRPIEETCRLLEYYRAAYGPLEGTEEAHAGAVNT